MCRAEAHQLYSRKPIFDALGFQLVSVLHEQIDSEVIFIMIISLSSYHILSLKINPGT